MEKPTLPTTKTLDGNSLDDPTKSSVLSSGQDNRRYWNIIDAPADQMFLARMLKGVLPVSDVVFDESTKKFYSYEMPVERVEKTADSSEYQAHMKADRLILALVFDDRDHGVGKDHEQNMRSAKGAHVFFDFANVTDFWESSDPFRKESEINAAIDELYPRDKEALSQKASQLENAIKGSEGLDFLTAIVTNMQTIGAGLPSILKGKRGKQEPLVAFQKEALKRLALIKYAISQSR